MYIFIKYKFSSKTFNFFKLSLRTKNTMLQSFVVHIYKKTPNILQIDFKKSINSIVIRKLLKFIPHLNDFSNYQK